MHTRYTLPGALDCAWQQRHTLQAHSATTYAWVQGGVERWIALEKYATTQVRLLKDPEEGVLSGLAFLTVGVWASRKVFRRGILAGVAPALVGVGITGVCFHRSIAQSMRLHRVELPEEVRAVMRQAQEVLGPVQSGARDAWERISKALAG
jgi:hypothetical protein